MEFKHYSVMADEVIDGLEVKNHPAGIYVDCTLGGAGHTKRILSLLGRNGRVIGIDLDGDAIQNAEETVHDDRLLLWQGNFKDMKSAVSHYGFDKVNGVLLDLGVSSYQIDTPERGFSYIKDAPLDMRLNRDSGITAADVVNTYSQSELIRILRDYGEEKYATKIASGIVSYRENKKIETTIELADLIVKCCPGFYKKEGHPAKKSFQAIRIEVNGELDGLDTAIEDAVDLLEVGGRACVISFHSLEDRIVKNTFNSLEHPCTCPKDFPVCVCGKMPIIKNVTKKPIVSSDRENAENTRSHSAKLRIAEKI